MRLPVTPGSYEPGSLARGGQKASVSQKPRVEAAKCTQCLVCWIYCPDSAVAITGTVVDVDMAYCKACGICATECPERAIQMVKGE